jgi:hypothetical protein
VYDGHFRTAARVANAMYVGWVGVRRHVQRLERDFLRVPGGGDAMPFAGLQRRSGDHRRELRRDRLVSGADDAVVRRVRVRRDRLQDHLLGGCRLRLRKLL